MDVDFRVSDIFRTTTKKNTTDPVRANWSDPTCLRGGGAAAGEAGRLSSPVVEGASRTRVAVAGVLGARAVAEGAGAAGRRLGRSDGTRVSSGARVALVVPSTCWIHICWQVRN